MRRATACGGSRGGGRRALPLLALACLAAGGPGPSRAQDAAPVPIHPAVGDTLDAVEAARYGLFADEPGLRDVVMVPAPWGGYLARLRLRTAAGLVIRERNVTTGGLRDLRARIDAVLAGSRAEPRPAAPDTVATGASASADLPDSLRAVADSLRARAESRERVKVWPEAPLPPPRTPPPGFGPRGGGPRAGEGAGKPVRWLLGAGLGYRHCLTEFGDFFTDQGLFEVVVSHRMTGSLSPYFAFQVGFGDIQDDFEAVSRDGRSALYALELGMTARTAWGERSWLYAGAGGGYYMRSLRWGGEVFVAPDGYLTSGTLVWELRDWGFALRTGVQFARGAPGRRARLIDVQLRYEDYDRSELSPFGPGDPFFASGRDRWIALSVGLATRL